MTSLQGRNVLVTGGGTGIGLGIALAFAAEGARVAIAGRRREVLVEGASRWSGNPPLWTHVVDVADRDSVHSLFAWAERELGQLDVLVNSAGINVPERSMAELDPSDWDRLVAVNATGAYNCMREVLPQMRERGDGLIINISSTSGKRASLLGGVAYSASKFAMSALGTAAALEEGHRGVRVTTIYPGEVNTPILDRRPVPVTEEKRARILQPEDLGHVAVMVARLPPRAHVAELVIKPTTQDFA